MRLKKRSLVACRVVLLLSAAVFTVYHFQASPLNAQVQSKNKSAATASNNATAQKIQPVLQPVPNADQPYLLSSRIHMQAGSNQGYLVVRVDLLEGSHIYSLTQKGEVRPTKLTVTPSPKFRLLGNFTPDRPAEVTVVDAMKKQTIEKHKSTIQFVAPIAVAAGTDPSTVTTEVVFDGQVCTAENFCMPIMSEKVAGKFAGYFPDKTATSKAPVRSAQAQPEQKTESSRVQR